MRYALNAANARWGQPVRRAVRHGRHRRRGGAEKGKGYNPVRGAKVIEFARNRQAARWALARTGCHRLRSKAASWLSPWWHSHRPEGRSAVRRLPGRRRCASSVLLVNNGLHIDIRSTEHPHRQSDAAGVADVVLEAALSTILDLEDSVAAVDAEDKVLGYSNWLGILKGTLTESFDKGGKTDPRPEPRPRISAGDGKGVKLHGRSLMFVRNVGHLMTNPPSCGAEGREIPEGIWTLVTTAIALHDLRAATAGIKNSAPAASTSSSPRCTAR
jgi:malate synthase